MWNNVLGAVIDGFFHSILVGVFAFRQRRNII
jgi:hypothetical protein